MFLDAATPHAPLWATHISQDRPGRLPVPRRDDKSGDGCGTQRIHVGDPSPTGSSEGGHITQRRVEEKWGGGQRERLTRWGTHRGMGHHTHANGASLPRWSTMSKCTMPNAPQQSNMSFCHPDFRWPEDWRGSGHRTSGKTKAKKIHVRAAHRIRPRAHLGHPKCEHTAQPHPTTSIAGNTRQPATTRWPLRPSHHGFLVGVFWRLCLFFVFFFPVLSVFSTHKNGWRRNAPSIAASEGSRAT